MERRLFIILKNIYSQMPYTYWMNQKYPFRQLNQILLAEEINKLARLLQCQFIIATHSPFMLGTLHAKIYNLDTKDYEVAKWSDLDNVRYFYDFFKKHENEFT